MKNRIRNKKNNNPLTFLILFLFLLFCFTVALLFSPSENLNSPSQPSPSLSAEKESISSKDDAANPTAGAISFSSIYSYLEETFAYIDTNKMNGKENTVKEEIIPADRTVYKEGFYYEPLSEEIRQQITGISYKENPNITYDDLRYVSVLYVDFMGNTQTGELICNQSIAQDMVEIFEALYVANYPIEKIRLIDEYGGDDDLSCADNNTSCFNYRVVGGTNNLSKHALGLAIDINPFYNPYITYPDGVERISPEGSEPYAHRDSGLPHMILKDDLIYRLFTERGFTWGGEWKTLKDYQHFQKTP